MYTPALHLLEQKREQSEENIFRELRAVTASLNKAAEEMKRRMESLGQQLSTPQISKPCATDAAARSTL